MRRDCLKIWNALLNCITAHHPIVADESPAIRNCCPHAISDFLFVVQPPLLQSPPSFELHLLHGV